MAAEVAVGSVTFHFPSPSHYPTSSAVVVTEALSAARRRACVARSRSVDLPPLIRRPLYARCLLALIMATPLCPRGHRSCRFGFSFFTYRHRHRAYTQNAEPHTHTSQSASQPASPRTYKRSHNTPPARLRLEHNHQQQAHQPPKHVNDIQPRRCIVSCAGPMCVTAAIKTVSCCRVKQNGPPTT